MKKTTKYFLVIGIVSLALGIGTGFLIKSRMNAKAPEITGNTERHGAIGDIPAAPLNTNPTQGEE